MTFTKVLGEIGKLLIPTILAIGATLYVFSKEVDINESAEIKKEINSKPSYDYVDSKDAEIVREMKEEDSEIRGEMENIEGRFNQGDDRILLQMKEDKKELIEIIKMNQ